MGIGILKCECAVQPACRRRAAIAEEATQRVTSPSTQIAAAIVLLTWVFPQPPAL